MRRTMVVLAAALIAGHFQVRAQDQEPLRLTDLIKEAIANNPEVQAAEQRWIAASQIGPQVGAWEDPMVTYTRWLSTPETRVGPQENVLMLSQRIPFPGKLGKMESMANEDASAVRSGYGASRRDLVFKVKNAYFDLYSVDQSLRILDDYLALLQNFSRVAEERYRTGEGIQANVLKSQVEVSGILEKRIAFSKMRTSMAERLNALLNRPEQSPVAEAMDLDTTFVVLDDSLLMRQALVGRQELEMSRAMIRKSEAMNDLARLDYFPNFTVQFSYITVPKVPSMFADAGKDPYSVSLGINLPLQLGRRSARVEEAEAMQKASVFNERNMQNMVKAEIRDLAFQLRSSAITIDLYRTGLLIQAESSLESAFTAYQTGKMDFLNLLDSERMLLQIRLGFVKELSNYRKVAAALERAIGGNEPS